MVAVVLDRLRIAMPIGAAAVVVRIRLPDKKDRSLAVRICFIWILRRDGKSGDVRIPFPVGVIYVEIAVFGIFGVECQT